ncbi:cystatin domain-containing protein [Novosphingobium sp. MD-1]|uniref:cystatin domain-containing protein n=1 Tax=Novosphingobium sp. MD-1 TaxID=1630648 RepID=UPI00061BDACA|nr:cystatin domain-containing protein [Novosphingobium sp. MD-1]GAO54864.1 hypothetical protein NMD1_01966 [Novosphingobium sp. MD-1]
MTKTLSLALYGALYGALCAAALAPAAAQVPPPGAGIPGGWAPAGVNDPQVRQAADFAASQLPGGGTVRSVDSASQQVVAGMNYRIELTLADGSRWAVTVYRMLSGQMRLSESTRLAAAAPQVAASLRLARNGLQVRRAGAAPIVLSFGIPRARVLEALRFRPAPRTSTNGECGAGPVDFAQWQDGVSLLFQHDRFGGWVLSGRNTTIGTTDGIRIGTTLAELRKKRGFRLERTTLGHEFTVGAISGIVNGTGARARVTDLWAGLSCAFR